MHPHARSRIAQARALGTALLTMLALIVAGCGGGAPASTAVATPPTTPPETASSSAASASAPVAAQPDAARADDAAAADSPASDDTASPITPAAPSRPAEAPPAEAAEDDAGTADGTAGAEPAPAEPLPFDNAAALDVLRHLSVEIGPRTRGTPGEAEAAAYLAATFDALGYTVERQAFQVPSFRPGAATLIVDGENVAAEELAFSAGGQVSARVVAVPGVGSTSDFTAVDVAGAIALVERGVLFFRDKVANATAAGAAAVILYNNAPGGFSGSLAEPATIPVVSIAQAAGLRLRDAAAAGNAHASLVASGSAGIDTSENVIARRSDAACRIYVGGHYDTVADVPGANDNGSGTALVVELARAFASAAAAERVCFVAFGSEEAVAGSTGLDGSAVFVARAKADGSLAEAQAMLNLDVAAAGTRLLLVGSASLTDVVAALAAALEIEATPGTLPPGTGSDYLSFLTEGVPAVFPTVTGSAIHVPGDTFDAADPAWLDRVGRLAHATLICLLVRDGAALDPPAGCPLP